MTPCFQSLGLDPRLVVEYTSATPIQSQAIPIALAGKDLVASAQTGTGKTAAFILPTLQKLLDGEPVKRRRVACPRALILVPTRELAKQVTDKVRDYSSGLKGIRSVCLMGGVPYHTQRQRLERGCDVLVATPGRLMDLMDQKIIDLSCVEVLILDEADRMLDMGFIEAVEEIADQTPKTRQTLLFSATLNPKVVKLSGRLQKSPEELHVRPSIEENGAIEQQLFFVDDLAHKKQILEHLLVDHAIDQAIIFTSTKRQADELSEHLREVGHRSGPLHGDMNQRQRNRTVERLRKGEMKFLVATDVAARGIDISTVSHVVNFDLPFQPEDFIHRVGRTGRAGASGTAITFATYREQNLVKQITDLLGQPIPSHTIEGLEPKAKVASKARRTTNLAPKKKGFFRKSKRFGPPPARKKSGGRARFAER